MKKIKLQTLMKKKWVEALYPYFQTNSFRQLNNKIVEDRKTTEVYPAKENIFRVFNELDIDEIKVVMWGQDPYHGCYHDGRPQAIGRAFALDVTGEMNIQPSLRNITLEIGTDIGLCLGFDYTMQHLVDQGVFLLNTTLTVAKGQPNSHSFYWKEFTKLVCETLNKRDNLVHLMMGKHAQDLKKYFNNPTHKFVETVHPSPLSAHKGFFGSKPFSKVNDFLRPNIIYWQDGKNAFERQITPDMMMKYEVDEKKITTFLTQEEIEIIPPKNNKDE